MEKINLPELTLADIMRNIRTEAQSQPSSITETHVSVSSALNTDFTQVNRYPKETAFIPKIRYTTADFCQHHDKTFIRHLFNAILKREPDEAGMDYYLSQLRSGKRTKREIIANMRFSKEGRAHKVRVQGILLPFLVALFYRLPMIGYILKLLIALAKLPKLVEKVHQLEALNHAPKPELVELERYFKEQINQKANRHELESKANRHELESKADRSDLALKANREELIMKANREELNTKANRTELDLKANREELAMKADRDELDAKANRHELETKANCEDVSIRVDWAAFEGYTQQLAETLTAKQVQFDQLAAANASFSSTQSQLNQTITQKQAELEHMLVEKQAIIDDLTRQVRDHKVTLLDNQRRLQLLLEEARKRLPKPLSAQQLKNISQADEHLQDAMYIAFEDKFRGTRADIKQRQKVYLPYIATALTATADAPILDVGCGRGEWLELLQEHGIKACGLDLNSAMIHECHQRNLDAQEREVVAHLRTLPSNSLAAITGFHIIEHLPFKILLNLLDECLRVLKPGGIVIFETPNPENLLVGSYLFYTDPTHLNPLVPETTRFLLEQRGFMQVEIKRLHKYSDYYPVISTDPFLLQHVYNELDFGVIGCKM